MDLFLNSFSTLSPADESLREAAKKNCVPTTKALTPPPPLELSGNIFLDLFFEQFSKFLMDARGGGGIFFLLSF